MSTASTQLKAGRHWTAEQLRKMPPAERDAILLAAAKRAEGEYRTNSDLTSFEAFGKEDLHGDSANANRGEIWLVNFDPAVGEEIRKLRPAVVISIDTVGRLPLRLVVPITDWKPQYAGYPWFVELPSNPTSGLIKRSGADAFQTKSVSVARFGRRLGTVTAGELDAVASAVALCVGAS